MGVQFQDAWLSDDPVGGDIGPGEFGRVDLAAKVLEVLVRVRKQSSSTTLGLIGPWGSGKSTVLNDLVTKLRTEHLQVTNLMGEEWSVAQFNPWLYSDTLALHEGFFAELRAALPDEKKWKDARNQIAKIGRAVSPLGALAGLAGLDAQRMIDAVADRIALTTTEQRAVAESKLRGLNRPVLMVIDDLDRLSSDELLHLFKLVRLVGRLPNVYYLLSYDERTLTDLLSKTDLVGPNGERRALDYLEKIVQIRIDIPLLRLDEVDSAVDLGLRVVAERHRLRQSPIEIQELQLTFSNVLGRRLRTPRALKRYFGQLDAFLSYVGDEVHFGDFAVLTWLRTVEPGVYNLLQDHRGLILGERRDPLREIGSSRTVDGVLLRQAWLKRLGEARVSESDCDDVLYILSRLFPRLRVAYEGKGNSDSAAVRDAPVGRIANADYFDRYFAFGVPDDDIADSVVASAARQLELDTSETTDVLELADKYAREPDLILRKLSEFVRTNPATRPGLLRWIADMYAKSDRYSGISRRLEAFAANLVVDLDREPRDHVVDLIAREDVGLYLVAMAQSILAEAVYGSAGDVEKAHAVALQMKAPIDALLADRFIEVAESTATPLAIPAATDALKWLWRSSNPQGFREFLRGQVDEGGWSLLDELAWLVPTTIAADGTQHITRYDEFEHFSSVFDLDAASIELGRHIESADATQSYHSCVATPETRRGYALALLRNWRDRTPLETDNA